MPVLNFSYATVKDTAAFGDYVRKAAELMKDHDIEIVLRSSYRSTFRGDDKAAHVAAVFRYPDIESAMQFYESDAYQNLVPLRDAACDMEIRFYDE
jgi:uncharacterized protein (DUF1330 family)